MNQLALHSASAKHFLIGAINTTIIPNQSSPTLAPASPNSTIITSSSHREDGFPDGFQVIADTTYDDGTILLRIRPNTNRTCESEPLYLRIITTDGAILSLNISSAQLSLGNSSFCSAEPETSFSLNPYLYGDAANNNLASSGYYTDNIKIFAIARNYILLNYLCRDPSQSLFCWMVLDWTGNVLKRDMPIGGNCDALSVVQNINSQSGFLWVCYMNSTSQLNWTKVSYPDTTGDISVINSGTIYNIQKFSPNFTSIFPTEDGGYGVVTAQYTSVDNSTGIARYYPPWTAFVNFIPPGTGNETKGPFQIFQQTNQILVSLNVFRCTISFASFGYNCIMYQIPLNSSSSFLSLEFLKSGAVINTTTIDVNTNNLTDLVVWDAKTLFEGGYLIMTERNHTVDGKVYANNGDFYSDWEMPTSFNYTRHVGVFPNNTIWAIALGNDNRTWTYVSNYGFSNYRDVPDPGGYGNTFVLSTTPQKAATISGRETTKLSINFKNPVGLTSDGNVSIWQLNSSSSLTYSTSTTTSSLYFLNLNSADSLLGLLSNSSSSLSPYLAYETSSSVAAILRQTFSGTNSQFVRLINGNTTVEFDALESTFNQKGAVYFVTMDSGFVEDSTFVQPLLGLRPLAWNFTTNSDDPDTNSGSLNAIIRLTPTGTSYYTSLSKENRTNFIDQLSKEISSIVPCSSSRLHVNRHYQFDRSVDKSQILMRVSVDAVSSTNTGSSLTTLAGITGERSSSRVIRDLDVLIRNRDVTMMSQKPFTSFLDPNYGCQVLPNLWLRYRWILFGVSFGLLILLIIFLISRSLHKEGRSFVIFTFTLIIVDFVMDILFLIFHGHDLNWLFDVSISFLIIPIGINIIFTFIIITHETAENNGFSAWWFKNPKVALIFTFLSSADAESLDVMSSESAEVSGLSAPFSARGLKNIIMLNFFSILIEDLPQLVILILYQAYTIVPAIIPILTLSSCSIVIPLKIVSLIYLLAQYKHQKSEAKILPSEDVRSNVKDKRRESSSGEGTYDPILFPIKNPINEPKIDLGTEGDLKPISELGGSSVTPLRKPYESKLIERFDAPEEQPPPSPPKKSLSFRLGLFGSRSKKNQGGILPTPEMLRLTLPKTTQQFLTSYNITLFGCIRDPKNSLISRFNLKKNERISVRSYIPRTGFRINIERRRVKPSVLKPILFTLFASGASFVAALTCFEHRRRKIRREYLQKSLFGGYVGYSEDQSNSSEWYKIVSQQFETLKRSKIYQEIEGNWNLVRNKWYSMDDGKKILAALIGVNAVVFGMWQVVSLQPLMNKYFVHHPLSGRVITLFTSMFSHQQFWHFGMNMMALYSFGDIIYHLFGREQFLAFYVTSGIVSSCVSHVASLTFMNWKNIAPSLGASGAIYACLSVVAVEYPNMSVALIFLPFLPIKISYALSALVAFDLFGIFSGMRMFDHFAHLSGAIFGIVYNKFGKEQYWKIAEALKQH
ncbi:12120_t:CDS:10 [Acaulospora morrowiae]|uniref:12120_t:CDS:1 n=1 Tax=Acaulospora morrowiae TaxID=94023 RepID=A0A9N8WBX4_9GLOM|nr:12120_t:CDS:10 [Acaulospora morrowiae]